MMRLGKNDFLRALILFVSAVFFYLACSRFPHLYTNDGLVYRELARNLPEAVSTPHPKFLPLYPALMAGLDLLTGRIFGVERWGNWINFICGGALVSLLYMFSLRLGAERRWAWAAALIQFFSSVGIGQVLDLSVLPLFSLEIFGLLFLLAVRREALAGVVLGLAVTTRYEAWLMLPVLAFSYRHELRRIPIITVGFVIAAAPWFVYNLIVFGHGIHTVYFSEIRLLNFNLPAIILGLLWEAGPFTVFLSCLGYRRLPKSLREQSLGFALFYIAIHTVWWWYQNRFLLPLFPPLLLAAALGMGRAEEMLAPRRGLRLARAALLAGLVLPLMLRTGFFIKQTQFSSQEPTRLAGIALAQGQFRGASIGANDFLLYADSGRPAYSWEDIKANEDPNEWVLNKYLEKGARQAVWTILGPVDRKRFTFLRDDRPHFFTVRRPEGLYRLSYTPANRFGDDADLTIIYDLTAEKMENR